MGPKIAQIKAKFNIFIINIFNNSGNWTSTRPSITWARSQATISWAIFSVCSVLDYNELNIILILVQYHFFITPITLWFIQQEESYCI